MNQCPQCGYQRPDFDKKCPQCDGFYSKIDEFLAEEEAKAAQYTFKTRLKRIINASDRKQASVDELRDIYQAMPKSSWWILYLIMTFIFAMTMMVI